MVSAALIMGQSIGTSFGRHLWLLMLCTLILYAASIHMYGTVLFLLLTKEKDTRVNKYPGLGIGTLDGMDSQELMWWHSFIGWLIVKQALYKS